MNRIDSTNCTHEAALARIAELESKLASAENEIGTHVRAYMDQFERANALQGRLDKLQGELRGASEEIEYQASLRNEVERRLGEALKFVTYIKNRYEQEWDDPITERFYNEAVALLGPAVERGTTK